MENITKKYVKIYDNVILLISDNISKNDIKEFLNEGGKDLYNWFLDKYSSVIFELDGGVKYGFFPLLRIF